MYVHLLVIGSQRCYVSNWYFDTITTSSPSNSEHPSWILENNTDVKRRRYVGNTAILCLDKGNVYLNTCRTYQAPGQTLEGVTPIFLYNESNSVNKIVNTFITEGFVKYRCGNSSGKYIVNDNDFNIVVLSKESSDVLIKLYDFDQVYNHNSIIFDIETSCNGIPVIAKVASYYDVDTDTITVTPLIDNISDIKDYTDKYNVRFYKTEKSLYYRCTTKYLYNNIYIIKYNNALKNITPVISTDSVNSAQEVQSYYSNYAYIREPNTGISTSTALNDKNIGFEYFDTTLNKSIWWNGAKWVGSDGNDADSPMSGSFADRPTGVKAGYSYFCTDKQTTEGSTNGIMIYYRGSNTWVDALGRVVS